MSFRTEKKALLNLQNMSLINELIYSKNFEIIYNERVVKSIYFDTLNFDCFLQSDEGVVPRKKFRIRSYTNSNDKNFYYEKKISALEGRYKETSFISRNDVNKFIKNGIYDQDYGYIFPILNIQYKRKYFKYKSWRITLDEDIKYSNFINRHYVYDTSNVIEFKSFHEKSDDELIFNFPLNFSRFSKYCNGIRMLGIL
jgi:succinate dehydrogenase flavin-adding protein (antitoxin of CptAB toxin-antitoxin module)